jgi:hypothetical protein
MGSGIWSTDVYDAADRYRRASGVSAFAYSDGGARSEHPQSTSIAVLFDVTGSMRGVPRVLQQKLPQLLGLLTRQGYAKDPQIMFGAIGDATCDRVPLQIGQFESDNRMDDDLGRIVLEGGGGGQQTESYELALYFMARHTALDCFEKRGRRGYLFIIGDEMAYGRVKAREVRGIVGDKLREDVPLRRIVEEVRRMYDVYYLLPAGSSYAGSSTVLGFWRDLLGQNAVELDDLDAVCETIALTVGLGEGAIDLDSGLDHLVEAGSRHRGTVGQALAPLQRGGLVRTDRLPVGDAASGNERL